MKSIFLSVLTNIPEKYIEEYDNFLNLLKLQNLTVRTLGTTDFAHKTPLEEVAELMYQCEGAIVLGFSQLLVTEVELNNKKIKTPFHLTTEWNHIEAAIAYSIGLPILVIHDSNISRGIFDKGVLNSFLYMYDLTQKSWSSSKEITGAIAKWQSLLKAVKKPNEKKKGFENPKVKWGCFIFPPDEELYCPYCYNKDGEKQLTTRDSIKNRKCTSCKNTIPTM